MKLVGGIFGGVVGGLIGAAIWVAVAYFLEYQVGLIAWAVGGLVGFGTLLGAGRAGILPGVLAVVLTALSIVGGKYVSIHLQIREAVGTAEEAVEEVRQEIAEEAGVVSWVAFDIALERTRDGDELEWPEGMSIADADKLEDFPPAIRDEARSLWEARSDEEKEAYRLMLLDRKREGHAGLVYEYTREAFKDDFDLMDIIFFLLGVATAWKLAGSGGSKEKEEEGSGEAAEPAAGSGDGSPGGSAPS